MSPKIFHFGINGYFIFLTPVEPIKKRHKIKDFLADFNRFCLGDYIKNGNKALHVLDVRLY